MPMTPRQLRKALKELSWTQRTLAEQLGVHVQTVKKWLAGDRHISEPVAILIRTWLAQPPAPARRRR